MKGDQVYFLITQAKKIKAPVIIPSKNAIAMATMKGIIRRGSNFCYYIKLGSFRSSMIQATAQHTIRPGDSLAGLAQQYLGDSEMWGAIAEINGVDPTSDEPLSVGDILSVPQVQDVIQGQAQRLLTPIAATAKKHLGKLSGVLGQVSGYVDTASSVIGAVDGVIPLPDELKGYTEVAQGAIAEVNGVLGQAESGLSGVFDALKPGSNGDRQYESPVSLVDWLLEPVPDASSETDLMGNTLSSLGQRVSSGVQTGGLGLP